MICFQAAPSPRLISLRSGSPDCMISESDGKPAAAAKRRRRGIPCEAGGRVDPVVLSAVIDAVISAVISFSAVIDAVICFSAVIDAVIAS